MKKNIKIAIIILTIIIAVCAIILCVYIAQSTRRKINADIQNEYNSEEIKELGRIIRIAGTLYYDTGKVSNALRCGMMDGKITSHVSNKEIPKQDNEANFEGDYSYQFGGNGTIEVLIENEWIIFTKNKGGKLEKIDTNMAVTKRAVVVKVNEKYLDIMGFDRENDLYSVSFADEGNIGFKKGQEILIYFNGMVAESFPAQIGNVGKIEIIKEKSETQIPDDVLRFYYSSKNNVNVTVSELTTSGIALTIVDTNEYPYEYLHSYKIYGKVKNKDYTGVGHKIGEDTENSISGYTRNRSRIYMGGK